MKTLHSFGFGLALLSGFASVGCAAAMPSQDLLDARALYAQANQGPAPALNPDAGL